MNILFSWPIGRGLLSIESKSCRRPQCCVSGALYLCYKINRPVFAVTSICSRARDLATWSVSATIVVARHYFLNCCQFVNSDAAHVQSAAVSQVVAIISVSVTIYRFVHLQTLAYDLTVFK